MEFDREQATPDESSTTSPVTKTTEKSARSPGIDDLQAISLTFVYDLDISAVQVQDIQQQGEYETDSYTERENEVGFQVISKTCMTSAGRAVGAFVHFVGGRVGPEVKAIAIPQCGTGSIFALGVTCGSSLLVLNFALTGFSPSTPVFPSH